MLGVSVDTLRRWVESGRIEATRTRGGHRRFEQAEIQRVAATLELGAGVHGRLSPPARALPGTAAVLESEGSTLLARAGGGLYRGGRAGWFVAEPGASQAGRWLEALTDAAASGNYDRALDTSRRLARQAALAGVPAVECDTLVELFGAVLGRALTTAVPAEAGAARRLLVSLRQAMLIERTS